MGRSAASARRWAPVTIRMRRSVWISIVGRSPHGPARSIPETRPVGTGPVRVAGGEKIGRPFEILPRSGPGARLLGVYGPESPELRIFSHPRPGPRNPALDFAAREV